MGNHKPPPGSRENALLTGLAEQILQGLQATKALRDEDKREAAETLRLERAKAEAELAVLRD